MAEDIKCQWGKFSDIWYKYIDNLSKKRVALSIEGSNFWTEAHSWAVNLAYYLYRCGRGQEASYLIDGVRCGSVKYITHDDPFYSNLNRSLLELRIGFSMEKSTLATAYSRTVNELPYMIDTVEPKNIGYETEVQFPHTAYWFQPLALVYGVALSSAPNSFPSRSEVDPFGKNITMGNILWITRNYVEAVKASDWISTTHVKPPSWVMEPDPNPAP